MTVVASFELERWPILLGDVLISGPENRNILNLPTIGNINQVFPEGSGYLPSSVRQKICVINDNLVVGWAGGALHARSVVRQMRSELAGRLISRSELECFFRDLDPEHHGEVSFVGSHFDGTQTYTFGHGTGGFQSQLYGDVKLAGSGSGDLQRLMERFALTVGIADRSSVQNSVDRAVVASISMSSLLLGIEVTTGRNLLNFYGGGFEIAARIDGQFVKVGDITYIISEITEREDGSFLVSLPVVVNKYDYRDDLLLIRSMHIHSRVINNQPQLHIDRQSTNVIRPIDSNVNIDPNSIPLLDYNSKFACYFYLLKRKDGSSEFLQHTECVPDRNHGVLFQDHNNNINLTCVPDYYDFVSQMARENCSSYYQSKQR